MSSSDDSQVPKLMLKSTKDALLIIEAAERGLFPRLVRRLTEQERAQNIYSGAVFVYDEFESNIRRFTDTLVWSPSRIVGNYLVYREMRKHEPRPTSRAGAVLPPQPASARSLTRPRTDAGLEQSGEQKKREQLYVGSLTHNERFKPDGLVKRTFSLMTESKHIHIIGYYTYNDAMDEHFLTPSEHPEFANLTISQDLLKDKSAYRVPPRTEQLEDGRLVYADEGEKQITSDSEKTPVEADRASPPTSSINGPPGFPTIPSFPFYPPMGVESQGSSMHDLPPLRQVPSTRVWDPMPSVETLVYDGPAYTSQARTTTTQYQTSEFNAPTDVQERNPLPTLSTISLTPSPPPTRSALRTRVSRQNPYPNNQDRPRAVKLNIARSLREAEFSHMNKSLLPINSSEFMGVKPSPEYHGCPTWPIPQSALSRGGGDMHQDYTYSGATSDGPTLPGMIEPGSSHLESLSCEPEVGPSGEVVEYDAVPVGRYTRTENTSID
ncbi:unnamed protein product [Rhizoctonia solani]|uniref:Gti1/Pac2 family-domain-containing protein n=1 Tax=Rhizoctonia solani TaxID=456999 RepID=A0A8H3AFE2_9AGAM|nr:unnamed protein product [Rhizoctonia solani]